MSRWTRKWDAWTSPWWKTKKTEDKSKTRASSYWYDGWNSDFDYEEFYSDFGTDGGQRTRLQSIGKTNDLYKLASVRRAITNFVNIVTGRTDIPVRYASKSNSYTDGKTVTLSADINDHFDVGVGLALHEGSHIVLSDFALLQKVQTFREYFREYYGKREQCNSNAEWWVVYYPELLKVLPPDSAFDRLIDPTGVILPRVLNSNGGAVIDMDTVLDTIGQLCNWIEDRRIDAYIYKTAPGYRDYYVQMYAHYFNAPEVAKGLQSNEYRTEDFDSYMFRIINMTNPNTDLGALRGLREIAVLIDLKTIGRLKTTRAVWALSIEVFETMLRYIDDGAPFKKNGKSNDGDGKQGDGDGKSEVEITDITEGDGSAGGGGGGAINPKGMNGQMSATTAGDDDSSPTPSASGTPAKVTLSKSAAEKLRKILDKQRKFLQDGVKKKKVSSEDEKKLNSIDESGTDLVQVGTDYSDFRKGSGVDLQGRPVHKGVSCVFAKKLSRSMRDGGDNSFPFPINSKKSIDTPKTKAVQEGIALGTLLGNKLVVRSETRDTVFNRLNKGKIDGRMVASLGYGNDSVFYTREIDQYKKVNLHISLDYSGSMGGEKHRKMIVCAVAIVRACKIARNINVQVSVRSTTNGGGKCLPYIALIYDSRKDSFTEFTDLMGRMGTGNTTPEGLCFEAIMKNFIPSNKDMDSYFLNISDGEPTFDNNDIQYGGESAAQHTARVVNRIREQGINVLSYFVTEYGDESTSSYNRGWNLFKQCYGKDAKWINVQNLAEVTRSMNELFLKKTPLHQQ
jgi:hypothetical protein